jgi:hypothetical protein
MTKQEKEEEISKISRREFLKDAGLVVGGATIGSMAIVSACGGGGEITKTVTSTVTKTTTVGAGQTVTVTSPPITQVVETAGEANIVSFTVNGRKWSIEVKPHDTLQVALREQLGLISIKICV